MPGEQQAEGGGKAAAHAGLTGTAARGPGDPQGCVLRSAVTGQQHAPTHSVEGPGRSSCRWSITV